MPVPMFNILNGGKHATDSTDFQEFMVMPLGAPSYKEGLRWAVEVYHSLARVLKKQGHSTNVGDEGGFAPSLGGNEPAIEVILEAIDAAGYEAGKDVAIALDPASSELFDKKQGKYVLPIEGKSLTSDETGGALGGVERRSTRSCRIEDGMAEDDWRGWAMLSQRIGDKRAARRRRPVRDEHEAHRARHRGAVGEQRADQGEPDRDADGDAGGDRDGARARAGRR